MIDKLNKAFPHCISNECLDSDENIIFKVCDTEEGKAIIYRGKDLLCHPYLTVENNTGNSINVLSIDKCIFNHSDEEKCDCAVFNDEKFCFVELKKAQGKANNRAKKRKKAASQLLTTIKAFREKIDFSTHTIEAVLCVGHKAVKPAASASSSHLKALFAAPEHAAKLLDGSKITF